ncbi:hypothetical protein NBRC116493_34940 [Aurantivibrio infirmus]
MAGSKERWLTSGEIALAKVIFGNAIDYSIVKIHDKKYTFFQPGFSGMTPNGEIYIDGVYKDDYSLATPGLKSFYIHELVHVYQYQLKILNPISAAIAETFAHFFDYNKAYLYTLDASKDLLDYDIEQQAQIIQDYYRLKHAGLTPVVGFMQNKMSEVVKNNLFEKVLAKFLNDPGYARHTVNCEWRRVGGGARRRICKRILTGSTP